MIKVLSLFFFILFLFYNYTFYNSDTYREKSNNSHEKHKLKLEQYTVKLKKIETNKKFKTFIDNSEYFKKEQKQPKFWELIK